MLAYRQVFYKEYQSQSWGQLFEDKIIWEQSFMLQYNKR